MRDNLQIIAAAFDAGWAFVRAAETVRLLRPPYRKQDVLEVGLEVAEQAISKHGFQSVEAAFFSSWPDLIGFLDAKYIQLRRISGVPAPSGSELRQLMNYAPELTLLQYLDHAETKLMSLGKYEPALELLAPMLQLERVKSNTELSSRVASNIQRCVDGNKRRHEDECALWQNAEGDDARLYPHLGTDELALARRLQKEICERRQVLPIGA